MLEFPTLGMITSFSFVYGSQTHKSLAPVYRLALASGSTCQWFPTDNQVCRLVMCNAEPALAHLFAEGAVNGRLQSFDLKTHHVQIFDRFSNRMMIFGDLF